MGRSGQTRKRRLDRVRCGRGVTSLELRKRVNSREEREANLLPHALAPGERASGKSGKRHGWGREAGSGKSRKRREWRENRDPAWRANGYIR
jgi:hypothetical protein